MNCRLQQNVDIFGLQLRLTSIMPAKPSLDLITRRLVAALATCTSLLVKHTNQHLLVLKHLPLQLNERLVAGIVPANAEPVHSTGSDSAQSLKQDSWTLTFWSSLSS
jgi:hypothetical protein